MSFGSCAQPPLVIKLSQLEIKQSMKEFSSCPWSQKRKSGLASGKPAGCGHAKYTQELVRVPSVKAA